MKHLKKVVTMVLLLSLVCGSILVSKPASAKSVSKITEIFTLTEKDVDNREYILHKLSIAKKEKVFTKLEILDVKGKFYDSKSGNKDVCFGDRYKVGARNDRETSGPIFWNYSKPSGLTPKSFKKGNKFTSKKDFLTGKTNVEWYLPEGLKLIKVKVTYYTKSGKAGIKSLKTKTLKLN